MCVCNNQVAKIRSPFNNFDGFNGWHSSLVCSLKYILAFNFLYFIKTKSKGESERDREMTHFKLFKVIVGWSTNATTSEIQTWSTLCANPNLITVPINESVCTCPILIRLAVNWSIFQNGPNQPLNQPAIGRKTEKAPKLYNPMYRHK